MKVLYFGSYDPGYSRNHNLIKGLKLNRIEIYECRDNSRGLKKFLNLYRKHKNFRDKYDVMIIGFLGHIIVPFAKMLTRKPIIFDAFVSLYDSNVQDRKLVSRYSVRAWYYWFLDWLSMHCADIVLFDTNEHIKYAAGEFGIDRDRFRRIFVGTDPDIFYPRQNQDLSRQNTIVYFHGSFIPLQGVEYIIKAAYLLGHDNIEFHILGDGQTHNNIIKLSSKIGVKNVRFLERVRYEELPEFISQADICLGIFGDTAKTRRVIPNKVYEYAAMAKPIITADTPAIRELFDQDDLLLIKSGDPKILADAILRLKNDPAERAAFARNAYKKFVKYATPEILGQQLKNIIQQL